MGEPVNNDELMKVQKNLEVLRTISAAVNPVVPTEKSSTALRDEFAGAALGSLLNIEVMQRMQMRMSFNADGDPSAGGMQTHFDDAAFDAERIAMLAYRMADAMMNERTISRGATQVSDSMIQEALK